MDKKHCTTKARTEKGGKNHNHNIKAYTTCYHTCISKLQGSTRRLPAFREERGRELAGTACIGRILTCIAAAMNQETLKPSLFLLTLIYSTILLHFHPFLLPLYCSSNSAIKSTPKKTNQLCKLFKSKNQK